MNVKTIDIHSKEWFDKANGNSYFSARATINFGTETAKEIKIPFQYGYGDAYQHETFQELQSAGLIPKQDNHTALRRYCEENKIILRTSKDEKCLKRDVIEWGK